MSSTCGRNGPENRNVSDRRSRSFSGLYRLSGSHRHTAGLPHLQKQRIVSVCRYRAPACGCRGVTESREQNHSSNEYFLSASGLRNILLAILRPLPRRKRLREIRSAERRRGLSNLRANDRHRIFVTAQAGYGRSSLGIAIVWRSCQHGSSLGTRGLLTRRGALRGRDLACGL